MNVTIDSFSGFCFGVVYAIQKAEEELASSGSLYCLGDIVHNNMEVDRLTKKGLKVIDHNDLKNLHDCKVLIRAHGEPPETYQVALANNIELIDASCPVVLKLQHRVRVSYDNVLDNDGQIVIYGEIGHAEVNGLVGQTGGSAIIVRSEEDLHKIDFTKPVTLFSQTTKSSAGFAKMKALIEEMSEKEIQKEISEEYMVSNDTICRQVSNREPQLRKFSKQHELILFVSGKKSSNGKALYDVCKSENDNTHFISSDEEIDLTWLQGVENVGICGATSTPMWLMEKVAAKIQEQGILS